MASTKEVTQLIRKLRKQGIPVVQLTGSLHWMAHCPNGQKVVIPSTPSDYRGWLNVLALLKRNGVNINNQPQKRKTP